MAILHGAGTQCSGAVLVTEVIVPGGDTDGSQQRRSPILLLLLAATCRWPGGTCSGSVFTGKSQVT